MTSWELIFLRSRVNNGAYDGDDLPAVNSDWPRGTWFQDLPICAGSLGYCFCTNEVYFL